MKLRIKFKPRIQVIVHPSGESKDQYALFKDAFGFNNKLPSDVSAVLRPREWEKCTFTENNGSCRESISVINPLDAQKFCFTLSLFHASTCFEHMCSSSGQNCITQPLYHHALNKLILK